MLDICRQAAKRERKLPARLAYEAFQTKTIVPPKRVYCNSPPFRSFVTRPPNDNAAADIAAMRSVSLMKSGNDAFTTPFLSNKINHLVSGKLVAN